MKFTILGEPQSKQRPRRGKGRHVYTPQATEEAEERIAHAFLGQVHHSQRPSPPDADHAWSARLVFYRYERRARDADNLVKLVMDALNGLAYADDSQVEVGTWTTIWVDTKAEAKTVVHLTRTETPARPPKRKAKALARTT